LQLYVDRVTRARGTIAGLQVKIATPTDQEKIDAVNLKTYTAAAAAAQKALKDAQDYSAKYLAGALGGVASPAERAAQKDLDSANVRLEEAQHRVKVDSERKDATGGELVAEVQRKQLELAERIHQVTRETAQIEERAAGLSDRARFFGTGQTGEIVVAQLAARRQNAQALEDLDQKQRDNRLGGPNATHVPEALYNQQRAALLKAGSDTDVSYEREIAAAIASARTELERYDFEAGKKTAEERFKNDEARIRDLVKAHEALVKVTEQSDRVAEVNDRADEIGLQQQFRKSSRLTDLATPVGSTGSALQAAQRAYQEQLNLASQLDTIAQRGIDRAAYLANLKHEEYDKDIAIAQAHFKLTQEDGEAAINYAIKVAEIERKRLEDARTEAGKVFDAAVSGPKGLENLAKSFALSQGKAVFENLTQGLFTSSSLHSLVSPDSPAASLLRGTILEPHSAAVDADTAALLRHIAALNTAVGPSAGGGGFVSPSGLSSVASRLSFPGASYNDLPFGTGGGTSAVIGGLPGLTSGNSYTDLPLGTGEDSGALAGALGLTSTPVSGLSSLSKLAGPALLASGGAFAAYSGFKAGGTRGALEGTAGIAAIASSILPLISTTLLAAGPIGAIAAAGLGLITSFLGDPRQNRSNAINTALQNATYQAPTPLSVTEGVGGGYSDVDRFGNFRSSSLSPYPTVQQPYFDAPYNTTIPGRTVGQFGGPNPQANTPPAVVVQISTMDAKSFLDNHQNIADAMTLAVNKGSGQGLVSTLRDRIGR
jgi:hypothetical protein